MIKSCCGANILSNYKSNRVIDKRLSSDNRHRTKDLSILLLGASESGKTTIFKQLRMYYGYNFTLDERKFFYHLIPENLLATLKHLIKIAKREQIPLNYKISPSLLKVKLPLPRKSSSIDKNSLRNPQNDKNRNKNETKQNQNIEQLLVSPDPEITNDPSYIISCLKYNRDFRSSIGNLVAEFISMNSKALDEALKFGTADNLLDSGSYWVKNHLRIFDSAYEVPITDILRARIATTGVEELLVQEQKLKYKILDVGGQRGERKKWIHLFERNISVLLYVASLAEYDQKDPEDESLSRISESLLLFENLINGHFRDLPVILFLNKKDIFEEKIRTKPLRDYFEDYSGGESLKEGMDFIRDLYVSRKKEMKGSDSAIYSYFLEATNTEMFGLIWKVVKSVIFEKNLTRSGLLYD